VGTQYWRESTRQTAEWLPPVVSVTLLFDLYCVGGTLSLTQSVNQSTTSGVYWGAQHNQSTTSGVSIEEQNTVRSTTRRNAFALCSDSPSIYERHSCTCELELLTVQMLKSLNYHVYWRIRYIDLFDAEYNYQSPQHCLPELSKMFWDIYSTHCVVRFKSRSRSSGIIQFKWLEVFCALHSLYTCTDLQTLKSLSLHGTLSLL